MKDREDRLGEIYALLPYSMERDDARSVNRRAITRLTARAEAVASGVANGARSEGKPNHRPGHEDE